MDMDFTLEIPLNLHMLTEEVELDCKELALESDPEKSCHCKASIAVFKDIRLGSILHIVISSNHFGNTFDQSLQWKHVSHDCAHCHILRHHRGDTSLCLQGTLPQKRAASQEYHIAGSGLGNNMITGVFRFPHPTEVSIHIAIYLPVKGGLEDQSTVLNFNQVPHNPIDSNCMRGFWNMGKLSCLVDNKDNVWP